MLSALLVIYLVIGTGAAQVLKFGPCPAISYTQNFDAQQYFTGRWYEQKRFFFVFEAGQKCATADYATSSGGHVSVTNTGYLTVIKQQQHAYGDAYCESSEPAYCHVRFSNSTPYADYKVLATDYKTYGLVFSCRNVFGLFNLQTAWILTRQKTVSADLITHAYDIYTSNGIDARQFSTTVQDCTYN